MPQLNSREGLARETGGAAWREWNPTLEASTTNPTIGNSTVTGQYTYLGDLVLAEYCITIGSTFSAGSGTYRVAPPVTPKSLQNTQSLGIGMIYDNGVKYTIITPAWSTATSKMFFIYTGTNAVGNSTPQAWATGDVFAFQISYRPA